MARNTSPRFHTTTTVDGTSIDLAFVPLADGTDAMILSEDYHILVGLFGLSPQWKVARSQTADGHITESIVAHAEGTSRLLRVNRLVLAIEYQLPFTVISHSDGDARNLVAGNLQQVAPTPPVSMTPEMGWFDQRNHELAAA